MRARHLDYLLLERPAVLLAVMLLLAGAALASLFDPRTLAPRFEVDPSMSALLPRSGEALAIFERARSHFSDDDILFVAWIADDLFSPARLAALKQLTRELERLPNVTRVDSLATAIGIEVTAAETIIDPVLRELPQDAAAAARLRERALANPLFRGRLVAEDGRGALVAVHAAPGLATPALVKLLDRVRAVSAATAGDAEQFVSGPLLVHLEISRILQRDLYSVTPLAAGATLLIAALAFRSVRGIVLPVLSNGIAVAFTLALFIAHGHALNFVTVILPPVVYVVGFSYAIHVVSEFDRLFVAGTDRRHAVRRARQEVFVPVTLTAVTTAIGFASLALVGIESIGLFGLYAALGALLAWGCALTVVPAGLLLLPVRPHAARELDAVATVAARIARFDFSHRRTLLIGGGALALAAMLAATRIEVDTDVLGNFPDNWPVQRDFQRIAEIFSGPVPLQVLVDADQPDAFKEPAVLRELARLGEWLAAQPEIKGVYTLADYVAMLHRAIAPEAAHGEPIPTSRRLVNHLLLGRGDDADRFVDPAFMSSVIHVRSTTLSTAAVNDLGRRIEARLAELPAPLRGHVTGSSFLVAHTVDDITIGQARSLGAAIAGTFVLLTLLFGSLRVGLLALVPNVLPIAFYFGLLGVLPITLNLTTSLVAASVFGIAVDDTVVFLSRFAIESRRQGRGDRAVQATLAAILRPTTVTMLALCTGFLALTAGELRSQREFGVLAAATLMLAWLIDLTLTPALCRSARIRAPWHDAAARDAESRTL